jgi:hypothetical protein
VADEQRHGEFRGLVSLRGEEVERGLSRFLGRQPSRFGKNAVAVATKPPPPGFVLDPGEGCRQRRRGHASEVLGVMRSAERG